MGTALVAIIDRRRHQIELDPAVRVGACLSGFGGEAVLLHTTTFGHCQETAVHVAKALRLSGWRVTIREFDEMLPLRQALEAGPGMVADDALSRLCAEIGPTSQPEPDRYRRSGLALRLVCRECFHVTNSPGRRSHERNIGHFAFDKVYRDDLDAYMEHVDAHGQAPDSTETVWTAPGTLPA